LTTFAQTEKRDIIEYTPPQGCTKTPKEGAVTYSYVNQNRTAFCVITLYASTASAGLPSFWSALTCQRFK
jgi:hypothetical protein